MNYYIQGDPDHAQEIKVAFERSGYDTGNLGFTSSQLYYTIDGKVELMCTKALQNIIKTHPDYKELEPPVEAKFKVGDWVVRKDGETFYGGNYAEQITLIDVNEKGKCIWLSSTSWINDDVIRPWTIEDAKDGDVLAINWQEDDDSWEKIVIFKKYHTKGVKGLFNSPCVEGYGNTFKNGKLALHEEVPYYSKTWIDKLQPATREQRDLLFSKIREAGYEWDADKKELKRIQPHYDISNFHAGMPVLVRETSLNAWQYALFSHYYIGGDGLTRFNASLVGFTQCIPFREDTKHLLGTTDPCDEQYINW